MDQRALKLLVGLVTACVALAPAAAAGGATLSYLEPHAGCTGSESTSTEVQDDGTTRREETKAARQESCASGRTVAALHVDEASVGRPHVSVDETSGSDSSRASTVKSERNATGARSESHADSSTATRSGYTASASTGSRDSAALVGCKTRSSVTASSSSAEEGATTRTSNDTLDSSDSLCGVHATSGTTTTAAGLEGGCAGRTSDEAAGSSVTANRTGACRDGVALRGPVAGFVGVESGIRESCTRTPSSSSCAGQIYHSLVVETSLGPGTRVPLPLGVLRLLLP